MLLLLVRFGGRFLCYPNKSPFPIKPPPTHGPFVSPCCVAIFQPLLCTISSTICPPPRTGPVCPPGLGPTLRASISLILGCLSPERGGGGSVVSCRVLQCHPVNIPEGTFVQIHASLPHPHPCCWKVVFRRSGRLILLVGGDTPALASFLAPIPH